MIKILVQDIIAKGLEIRNTIPKEGIGLSDEEIDLRSPIDVTAHLERVGNIVTAQVKIEADFGFLCARCLEDVHAVQAREYRFDFDIDSALEYIDLGEEIRQEMIMGHPARILCQENCKGMCSHCGVNLNQEECRCRR